MALCLKESWRKFGAYVTGMVRSLWYG